MRESPLDFIQDDARACVSKCERGRWRLPPIMGSRGIRRRIRNYTHSRKVEDWNSLSASERSCATEPATQDVSRSVEEDVDTASSRNGARRAYRPHRSKRQIMPRRIFALRSARLGCVTANPNARNMEHRIPRSKSRPLLMAWGSNSVPALPYNAVRFEI